VHLTALWLDSFVQLSWLQLLAFPWTSSYRPLAVTLGFLAMVALILTTGSGALRRHLPGWRIVHALAYLTFGLSVFHGILAGSDTHSAWAICLYAGALAGVGVTLLRRLIPKAPSERRQVVKPGPYGVRERGDRPRVEGSSPNHPADGRRVPRCDPDTLSVCPRGSAYWVKRKRKASPFIHRSAWRNCLENSRRLLKSACSYRQEALIDSSQALLDDSCRLSGTRFGARSDFPNSFGRSILGTSPQRRSLGSSIRVVFRTRATP
jgi:hypothetical protein